jgi:hypothetical protein
MIPFREPRFLHGEFFAAKKTERKARGTDGTYPQVPGIAEFHIPVVFRPPADQSGILAGKSA